MGRVYRAYDPVLHREVALKVVRHGGEKQRARLAREAQAQARVNHPHVCPVFETGEADGFPYIVMLLLDGVPLHRLTPRPGCEALAALLLPVAEALQAAHRQGLIHRDVKPANILVVRGADGALHPYVTDFGLARSPEEAEEGLTLTGMPAGTIHYMSPEQLRGDSRRTGRRSDVYGLGATLYELLAGRPPFGGRTLPETASLILSTDPPAPARLDRSVPADLSAIAMRCLEKNPDRRYGSAAEVADELRRYLDGHPVLARRGNRLYRTGKWLKRRRMLLAALLPALLVGLALGGLWLAGQVRQRRQAELEQQFAGMLAAVESRLLYAYVRPAHDTGPEVAAARRQLDRIRSAMEEAGELAEGPGGYALGRGWLLFGEAEKAAAELERAWGAGYRDPRVAYALGRALTGVRERRRAEANARANPYERQAQLAALDAELRPRLLELFRQGAAAGDEIPAEIYLALAENRFQEVADRLAKPMADLRWPFEAVALAGNAEVQWGDWFREQGDWPRTQEHWRRAENHLEAALAAAPGHPAIHAARCRLAAGRLAMEAQRGGKAEEAYRRALAVCGEYRAILPADGAPPALETRIHALWAERLHSLSMDATPAVQAAEASGQRALALDPADSSVLRALCTAWRVQTFSDGQIRQTDYSGALAKTEEYFARLAEVDVLRAGDFHNLGAARRIRFEQHRGNPDWILYFQQAETSLMRSLLIDASYVPAMKDLGYLWLLRGNEDLLAGRDPIGWYRESIRYSQSAVDQNPSFFDAWDNLAHALDGIATYAMWHGQDPEPFFQQAEEAWQADLAANPARPYAPARFVENVYLRIAWHNFRSGKNWQELFTSSRRLLSPEHFPAGQSHFSNLYLLATSHCYEAIMLQIHGQPLEEAVREGKKVLARIQKENHSDIFSTPFRSRNSFLHLVHQLAQPGLPSVKLKAADREFALLESDAYILDSSEILFGRLLLLRAGRLLAAGRSPVDDCRRLERHLERYRDQPLNRSLQLVLRGRSALLEARWELCRAAAGRKAGSAAELARIEPLTRNPGGLAGLLERLSSAGREAVPASGTTAGRLDGDPAKDSAGNRQPERLSNPSSPGSPDGGRRLAKVDNPADRLARARELARQALDWFRQALQMNRWMERECRDELPLAEALADPAR